MAYDAVSAPPPPPAKAAAPAAKADAGASQTAGQTGGAAPQSPFGALMAMLDGSQADAPATPQDPKAAQTPATQGAQPAKPTKTDASGKADDANDGDKTDAAQAQGQTDPATLMAGLLVQQPAQTPAPTDGKPVEAVATGAKPAAVPTDPALQLAAAEIKPDPKATDAKSTDAKPAVAAPVIPDAKAGDVKLADAKPVDARPAVEPTTQDVKPAVVAAEQTPATTDAKPTTGDTRRADARTDAARGQDAGAAQGQPQTQHAARDGGNQAGDQRSHDRSAEAQATTTEARPAAAVEMTAQVAAPDAAPAPATTPLAVAPAPQQLAATTPALLVQTATPVRGSPETVAQLAAQMIQRLEGQTTQFDVALNPQNLGRVDVRIEIDHRGALKARMAFDTPEAAKQLSGQQGELRAALEKAGFDLPDGALSFDVSSGGQQQGGGFADGRDSGPARLFQAVADAADPTPATPSYFTRAAASGVDIRI